MDKLWQELAKLTNLKKLTLNLSNLQLEDEDITNINLEPLKELEELTLNMSNNNLNYRTNDIITEHKGKLGSALAKLTNLKKLTLDVSENFYDEEGVKDLEKCLNQKLQNRENIAIKHEPHFDNANIKKAIESSWEMHGTYLLELWRVIEEILKNKKSLLKSPRTKQAEAELTKTIQKLYNQLYYIEKNKWPRRKVIERSSNKIITKLNNITPITSRPAPQKIEQKDLTTIIIEQEEKTTTYIIQYKDEKPKKYTESSQRSLTTQWNKIIKQSPLDGPTKKQLLEIKYSLGLTIPEYDSDDDEENIASDTTETENLTIAHTERTTLIKIYIEAIKQRLIFVINEMTDGYFVNAGIIAHAYWDQDQSDRSLHTETNSSRNVYQRLQEAWKLIKALYLSNQAGKWIKHSGLYKAQEISPEKPRKYSPFGILTSPNNHPTYAVPIHDDVRKKKQCHEDNSNTLSPYKGEFITDHAIRIKLYGEKYREIIISRRVEMGGHRTLKWEI